MVGQLHAFRHSGRARRVEQEHRVIGVGRNHWIASRSTGDPAFILRFQLQKSKPITSGKGRRTQQRKQFPGDDDQGGIGIRDNDLDLGRGEPPVQPNKNCPDLAAREREFEEHRVVLRQHCDAVGRPHSRFTQRVRRECAATVEITKRQGGVGEADRRRVGPFGGVGSDDAGVAEWSVLRHRFPFGCSWPVFGPMTRSVALG